MKKEFTEKLEKLLQRKKSNSVYLLNKSRYEDFIKEIKLIKHKYNKDYEDYKTLANYDVLVLNGRERLVKPKDEANSSVKFYIPTDELFGVLHTIHLLFQHADKDAMDSEIKTKYSKFMLSCSGERLMKLGDYTFLRSFYQNEKCYWSCYTHDNHGCGATALTECGIEAFFIQSLRGKPLIVFNKYTYCRHSIRNGIIRWTCSTHSYKCCKAVVKTSGGHIIEVKGSHNHDASELLINRGKPAVYDLSLSEQILIKSESFM